MFEESYTLDPKAGEKKLIEKENKGRPRVSSKVGFHQ